MQLDRPWQPRSETRTPANAVRTPTSPSNADLSASVVHATGADKSAGS